MNLTGEAWGIVRRSAQAAAIVRRTVQAAASAWTVRDILSALSVAASFSIVVVCALFVRQELSYDRAWQNTDELFRLETNAAYSTSSPGGPKPGTFPITDPEIRGLVESLAPAGAVQVMRIAGDTQLALVKPARIQSADDQQMPLYINALAVDPDFTDFFHLETLDGSVETGLRDPDAVILLQALHAYYQAYFGIDLAIGDTIKLRNGEELRLHAIIADPPGPTIIEFGALRPYDSYATRFAREQVAHDADGNVIARSESETTRVSNVTLFRARGGDVRPLQEVMSEIHARRGGDAFVLRALSTIHLKGGSLFGPAAGAPFLVGILTAFGTAVFLIALCNLQIAETVRFVKNGLKIAIEKTQGRSPTGLLCGLLAQSMVRLFVILAPIIVLLGLIVRGWEAQSGFSLPLATLSRPGDVWLLALAGFICVALTTAPLALRLIVSRPLVAMRHATAPLPVSGALTKWVVAVQFAVTLILALCALFLLMQVNRIETMDRGWSPDRKYAVGQLSVIANRDPNAYQRDQLMTRLHTMKNNGTIADVTSSSFRLPGFLPPPSDIGFREVSHKIAVIDVAPNFFGFFDIEPLAGRVLSPDRPGDSFNSVEDIMDVFPIVVSETAAGLLSGSDDPAAMIGEIVTVDSRYARGEIVGVVPDLFFGYSPRFEAALVYQSDRSQILRHTFTLPAGSDQTLKALKQDANLIDLSGDLWLRSLNEVQAEFTYNFRMGASLSTVMAIIALVITLFSCANQYALVIRRSYRELAIRRAAGYAGPDIVKFLVGRLGFPVVISMGCVAAVIPALVFMADTGATSAWSLIANYAVALATVSALLLLAVLIILFETKLFYRHSPGELLQSDV